MFKSYSQDLEDVWSGILKLKVAIWLASEDMRSRYTRSALGPWWNILSNMIFIGAMAITFGSLFGQPLQTYLPYLVASIACWNFISGTVADSPMSLVRGQGIIVSYSLPLSTQIFRLVSDKAFLFAHFMVVYVLVLLVMGYGMNFLNLLMFIPAIIIYLSFAVGIGLGFGVIGARYRDIHPAVNSIMIMAFLLTPVFWNKVTLGPKSHWIVDFNPLFHLLEIGRNPLLGKPVDPLHWYAAIGIAVLSLLIGGAFYAGMRRKIYYWL